MNHIKIPSFGLAVQNRFQKKIARGSSPLDCWKWLGAQSSSGYGVFHIDGVQFRANRVSFFFYKNKDPGEFCVCHKCDNPICVNSDHLFLGTNRDNTNDMMSKGRNRQARGEDSGTSILSEKIVLSMRAMYDSGEIPIREIANTFGVKLATAFDCIRGRSWAHLPPIKPNLNMSKKLSNEQAIEIRRLRQSGVPGGELAKKFKVSPSLISQIANKKVRCQL